ncbi:hypothetical protein [Oceaniglobus trochenteri]|uniref:COG3904 family protein n=1 Tax=Oceaniglobus trochenteri TaxID=2763260 RepID=UPI001D001A00|nr:hypothetical protein [Oceaniglobus trochenteri]
MKLASPSPGAMIKGILGLQLAMAGAMFGADLLEGWQGLALTPKAPRLESPVRPGDQTRRYRPGEMPDGPAERPFPPPTDMPERLQFQPAGAVLRLTGAIAEGDGARFARWLAETEAPPMTVSLNSPGGSVADALEIGRALREGGFDTELTAGDICLSACPYILVGGVARVVDNAAYVGVHQHYFGENTVQPAFMAVEDIQRGQGRVMDYLDAMGADPLLMRHALVTPPDEIYVFVREELERYRIVTGASDN